MAETVDLGGISFRINLNRNSGDGSPESVVNSVISSLSKLEEHIKGRTEPAMEQLRATLANIGKPASPGGSAAGASSDRAAAFEKQIKDVAAVSKKMDEAVTAEFRDGVQRAKRYDDWMAWRYKEQDRRRESEDRATKKEIADQQKSLNAKEAETKAYYDKVRAFDEMAERRARENVMRRKQVHQQYYAQGGPKFVDKADWRSAASPAAMAAKSAADTQANVNSSMKESMEAASSVAHAVTMLAAAAGAAKLADMLKEAAVYAGRVENLGTVLENVGRNVNYTSGELASVESRIKSLGITTEASRQVMVLFARNELDLAQAVRVSRIAQDAAVIAGLNSSETAEKMAISVQRLDTRMLRNMGILVNLRNEYQKYSLETGRVETSLTAHERQQILLNAVLRAGVSTLGTYESALQDVYKQYTTMQRFEDEATKELGEQYQGMFKLYVSTKTAILKSFIGASDSTKALTASILAATTALVGMAAAVSLLGFALKGLRLSSLYLGGWQIAAVVGVLTVAAGLFTYFSGKVDAARMSLEEHNRKLDESVSNMMRLRTLSTQVNEYAKSTNMSADAQTRFNEAIREAGSLYPDLIEKLSGKGPQDAAKELEKKLGEVSFPGKTLKEQKEYVSGIARDLEIQLINRIKETEITYTQAGSGPYSPGVVTNRRPAEGLSKEKIQEIIRKRMRSQVPMEAVGETPEERAVMAAIMGNDINRQYYDMLNTTRRSAEQMERQSVAEQIRDLEKLSQSLEIAAESAGRLDGRLLDLSERMMNNKGIKNLMDIIQARSRLGSVLKTEADIRKEADLKRAQIAEDEEFFIQRKVKDEVAQAPEGEEEKYRERGRAKAKQELAQRRENIDASMRAEIDQLERALRMEEEAKQLQSLEYRAATERLEILKEKNDAMATYGNETRESALNARNAEKQIMIGYKAERGAYEILLKNAEDKLAKNKDALKGMVVGPDRAKIEKVVEADARNVKDIADAITLLDATLPELVKEARLKWADLSMKTLDQIGREAVETRNKIQTITEDLIGLDSKRTAKTAEEAKKRREERRKEFREVEDFIRKERLSRLEISAPGVSSVFQDYEEYLQQIGSAQSNQQLTALQSLWPLRMERIRDEHRKKVEEVQKELMSAISDGNVPEANKAGQELQKQVYAQKVTEIALRESVTKINTAVEERKKTLTEIAGQQERELGLIRDEIKEKRIQLEIENAILDAKRKQFAITQEDARKSHETIVSKLESEGKVEQAAARRKQFDRTEELARLRLQQAGVGVSGAAVGSVAPVASGTAVGVSTVVGAGQGGAVVPLVAGQVPSVVASGSAVSGGTGRRAALEEYRRSLAEERARSWASRKRSKAPPIAADDPLWNFLSPEQKAQMNREIADLVFPDVTAQNRGAFLNRKIKAVDEELAKLPPEEPDLYADTSDASKRAGLAKYGRDMRRFQYQQTHFSYAQRKKMAAEMAERRKKGQFGAFPTANPFAVDQGGMWKAPIDQERRAAEAAEKAAIEGKLTSAETSQLKENQIKATDMIAGSFTEIRNDMATMSWALQDVASRV